MAAKKQQAKATDRAPVWSVRFCESDKCQDRRITTPAQAIRVRSIAYTGARSRTVWQWLHRACLGAVSK